MKTTGLVRRVDRIGRIVIPLDARRALDIYSGDSLEFLVAGDSLAMRRVERRCIFCGRGQALREFKGRLVCLRCLEALCSD